MFRISIYKGCFTATVVLMLMTLFCIFNVDVGSAPFYLCIFTLIVDVPFLSFLLYKLIKANKEEDKIRRERSNAEKDSKSNNE